MNNISNPAIEQQKQDIQALIKNAGVIVEQNKDKIETSLMESAANERAQREPIPSTINYAFVEDGTTVKLKSGKEVKIRSMKALDVNIFKIWDSPFHKLMMGDETEKSIKSLAINEEIMEIFIYQFTHDVKEIYKAAKKNKDEFMQNAIIDTGVNYNQAEMGDLMMAILEHITLVNQARMNFVTPDSAPEDPSLSEEDKKKLPLGISI